MKTRISRTVVLSLPAVIVCCSLSTNWAVAAEGPVSPLPASDYAVRPVCAAPAPGYAECLALELVPRTEAARARTRPLGLTRSRPIVTVKASEGAFGLRPQDLHSIYQLPNTVAQAQTIALVDAYNDPNIEADLKTYDKEFGLPNLTTCTAGEINDCFEQVNQVGETGNPPIAKSNKEKKEAVEWSEETTLDVEVSHAICQSCRIMLVEADSPLFTFLEAAEKTATRLGATEISNSWGGPEQGETPALDAASPFNHPGTVITAAAGDDGYLDWGAKESSERGFADYPASSPHVVAVGGTRLQGPLGPGGTWAGETVWNGDGAGGSGCSEEMTAQPWQQSVSDWTSVGCGRHRAVADISADADPYTGIAVYNSDSECEYEEGGVFRKTHWCTIGGTSLASPLIASVFALAGGANGAAYPAATLYENELEDPTTLHDVTSGSNGACAEPFNEEGLSGCTILQEAASCAEASICLAREGYDGPTGVGTPNGILAFEPVSEEVKQTNEEQRHAEAKLLEERRLEEQHEAEAEGRAGDSGTNGTAGSGKGTSTSQPGTAGASKTASPSTVSGATTIKLTAFALTPTALLALDRPRSKVSSIAFAFTLSTGARVRATLTKLVRVHGHKRWVSLPGALTFNATKGRNRQHLASSKTLVPGRYRLTLAPQGGAAPTLTFQVG